MAHFLLGCQPGLLIHPNQLSQGLLKCRPDFADHPLGLGGRVIGQPPPVLTASLLPIYPQVPSGSIRETQDYEEKLPSREGEMYRR